MQKTLYYCDQCKNTIGAKKHISLNLGNNFTGIAIPPKSEFLKWTVKKLAGFLHFCNGACIGKYFDKLIEEK